MENLERDKFLTEAMGLVLHKSIYTVRGNECVCGKWWSQCMKNPINVCDYSTWEGFGKLWKWTNSQKWIEDFEYHVCCLEDRGYYYKTLINPDMFANEVYEYLKEKEYNETIHS